MSFGFSFAGSVATGALSVTSFGGSIVSVGPKSKLSSNSASKDASISCGVPVVSVVSGWKASVVVGMASRSVVCCVACEVDGSCAELVRGGSSSVGFSSRDACAEWRGFGSVDFWTARSFR